MKKDTLIRTEQPHTVKVQPGSNVAQSKLAKKDNLVSQKDDPLSSHMQFIPNLEASKNSLAKNKSTSAKPRTKSSETSASDLPVKKSQNRPVAASSTSRKVKPTPNTKARSAARVLQANLAENSRTKPKETVPPSDISNVWEADNPIKQRLALLQARNIELKELVQRLQQPKLSRGKRP